ncbi:PREDICTED: probable multidrug resistance-associated protein lethal(2)03659 [Ceratosolen solmsi marchali]|uniref:Probable multidrug resistance-associated protein lethal(2)03659 n=1 Tax=Ceratosolen solmsi marchali TaxID=326594 RepID=A0AAJ6YN83_9HYME|nr:PREDICTED: probable multidrug resistance-associated protein lethal(2)03659 [Ceratosolen solmsi marchali]
MDLSKVKVSLNPREKADLFSVLIWWWTIELFKKGYSKTLTFYDLYEPLKNDRSKFLGAKLKRHWNAELNRAEKRNNKPSLFNIILLTFTKEILHLGILHFFLDIIFSLGLPLILGLLLRYFKLRLTSSFEEALFYFIAFIATNILTIMLNNHQSFQAKHLAGRIRIAIRSLIYNKALKLNSASLGETSSGKVINLLANDVGRYDLIIVFLHTIWTTPIATLIVAYILYKEAGIAGLIGIGIMLTTVPVQIFTGKLATKYRLETALKTDERVRLVDEIISGAQVIKTYAWEQPFHALVKLVRFLELKVIGKSSHIRGLFMTTFLSITRVALYFTIMSMLALGEDLAIDRILVIATFYNKLSFSLTGKFVRSFDEIAECKVSADRIQSFLLMKEFRTYNVVGKVPLKTDKSKKANSVDNRSCKIIIVRKDRREASWCIRLKSLSAKWCPSQSHNTLEDASLELEKGKLYVVLGVVGSGKSSFLSVILNEIECVGGTAEVSGSVSYAAQDAWICGASVRQNILFGQEFERRRYERVIEVCSLVEDFAQLPEADQTLLDEKGSSLSGGQRSRISLARAVYRQADIYLLDDPLSAVDARVGKHLIENCILGYLRHKTCILVTHQLQNLADVDGIIFFDQGKIQFYKYYHELLKVHKEYNNFIMPKLNRNLNENVEITEAESRFTSIETKVRRIFCYSYVNFEKTNDNSLTINSVIENSSKNVIKGSIFLKYFQSSSRLCIAILMAALFIVTQFLIGLNDLYVSNIVFFTSIANIDEAAIVAQGDVNIIRTYIYLYTTIVLAIFGIGLLRSYLFYNVCLRNSKCLHDSALSAILRAPMHFFEVNASGRILNRFSKDMDIIDNQLPRTMLDSGQVLLTITGAFIITCMVNPLFLIPAIVIAYVTYWIKRIYLKTSTNLKRLEGMTRSPLFTHLNITLNGISTIRAFKAQLNFKEEFDRFQDNHTSSWFLFLACNEAFSFALNLCTFHFIICIIFILLMFKQHFNSGDVGLAITQMIWVTSMVEWGMRQMAEINNQMMSVERILEYTQICPEDNPDKKLKVSKEEGEENEKSLIISPANTLKCWPSNGIITFDDVFLTYAENNNPVLKNLSFRISAMEKIGIVGRTGAGKSSIISAIFRLARVKGHIEIDGIDTEKLSLKDLRSRISIIPQDPVLFSGTLRYNLDPLNEFFDQDLWKALDEVELKDTISSFENGLNCRVIEKGTNFSIGQRQLICLARAILRNNRILAVDEATANVDAQTDILIQKTIRQKFATCTILTIAHRLNTIMDSDKIMVIDKGHLIEFEHPYVLLQKENSHFSSLVKETGEFMSQHLFNLAQECYNKKYSKNMVVEK